MGMAGSGGQEFFSVDLLSWKLETLSLIEVSLHIAMLIGFSNLTLLEGGCITFCFLTV